MADIGNLDDWQEFTALNYIGYQVQVHRKTSLMRHRRNPPHAGDDWIYGLPGEPWGGQAPTEHPVPWRLEPHRAVHTRCHIIAADGSMVIASVARGTAERIVRAVNAG